MRTKLDIEGQDVYLNVPDGAVVTGVILITSYQAMQDDGRLIAGSTWGTSAMPFVQSVGMMRIAALEIENQAISD